jgi:hypothetical protein
MWASSEEMKTSKVQQVLTILKASVEESSVKEKVKPKSPAKKSKKVLANAKKAAKG